MNLGIGNTCVLSFLKIEQKLKPPSAFKFLHWKDAYVINVWHPTIRGLGLPHNLKNVCRSTQINLRVKTILEPKSLGLGLAQFLNFVIRIRNNFG